MKDVFIIGSKGIPAKYGGFETFVDNLVSRQVSANIQYHVACMALNDTAEKYYYCNAECQQIKVPDIGGAKAILYDLYALNWALNEIKKNNLTNGIIYILACRVGPFIGNYIKRFHKYNFEVWVNPDGHEWKRAKWSLPVRKYWKISEKLMVKNADFLICDSSSIEQYIHKDYDQYSPKTTFIAYGADIRKSSLNFSDNKVREWYNKFNVKEGDYFLIVGRFVPENNFETMIKEFMKSDENKDLVIITNIERNKFFDRLKKKTNFDKDVRIKFVGTVYDTDLLKYIREHAFGYLHGHSVGGTNPSLLEALGSTKLNLLLNVGFNREVAKNAAIYWDKDNGSLSKLLNKVQKLSQHDINNIGNNAKKRIIDYYSWENIVNQYEDEFLK